MRKAAIVLGILLVLVLAGLGFAPLFFDLARLKAPIAAQLSERSGRNVELAGPIGLAFLPTPTLTARDVRVANPPGAAVPDMIRLRALEVKLALLPLLAGRLEVGSAVLVEPEIDVELLPGGELNWRASAAVAASRGGEAGAPRAAACPAPAIDRLSVQNGALTERFGGGAERLEHIGGSVILDADSCQLTIAGDLVVRGAAVSFQLRSGRLAAVEIPLQLIVAATPAARLQLDAALAGAGDDRRIAGKLKLTADDARAVLGTLAQLAVPDALAQPVTVSADVTGTLRQLALDRLSVDIGPAHGTGSVRFAAGAPPDLDLALSVARLDLDHWPVPRQAALAPAGRSGDALAAPPPAPPRAPDIAGLAAVNARIDVGIDAVLWRGGLVRDARLKLSLSDGALALTRLAAALPGGTDVSLSGSGALTAAGLRVEGAAEASADDLRGLCGWFGIALEPVPPDRLRKARLSGRFALAGDRLDLAAIDASLDTTRLAAAATVLLRQRPGIGVRLTADRFNLDAYLPQHAAAPDAAPAATSPAAAVPAARPSLAGDALTAFDANVDARLQTLTWHGQPIGNVHLAGTLQDSEASIRELSMGDFGGASANLSGVIAGLGGAPTGQIAFDMKGSELERLLRLVAPRLASGRSYGAFSLGGAVQVDANAVTLDTDLQLREGRAHVVGDIGRASGTLDLGFELEHPSLQRMLRGFSLGYELAGGDPGALKLAGRVRGDRRRFALEHVVLAIGERGLEGRLGVDLTGARPRLSVEATLGDWALDRLLPARQSASLEQSLPPATLRPGVLLAEARAAPGEPGGGWLSEPLSLAALSLADVELALTAHRLAYGAWHIEQPTLAASVTDGALSVRRLTGGLFGGDVEASGTLTGGGTLALNGRLALRHADLKQALHDAASLGFIDGLFDVDAELAGRGRSTAELLASLAGEATLSGHDGSIAGIALKAMNDQLAQRPTNLSALLRGAGGRTGFSRLEARFHVADGIARSDDLHLVAEGGEGKATASLDLPKWIIASTVEFRLAGAPAAPPLVMHIDGAIDRPTIILDVNPLEKYLSQPAPHP